MNEEDGVFEDFDEDEEWDEDLEEDEELVYAEAVDAGPWGEVTCFFHTGAPQTVQIQRGETVTSLRARLRGLGRNADGLAALVDGHTINAQYEVNTHVQPGANVTFSGSVKGG